MKKTISIILAVIILLSLLTITAPYIAAEDTTAPAIDQAVMIDETVDDERLDWEEASISEGYSIEEETGEEADENSVAASDKDIDLAETGAGITFNVSGTTLTISGSGSMAGLMEKNRSYPWSGYASTVKTVVINKGIKDISKYAFMNFSKMTSISLPDGITEIGEAAFYGCGSLSNISLPSSVKSIGNGAFYACKSITSINLVNVETVKDYAFQGTAVKSVSLGKSLTTISGLSFFSVDVTSFSVDNANQN